MAAQTSPTSCWPEPSPTPHLLLDVRPRSDPPTRKVYLRFRSPVMSSLGMQTALQWNHRQLIEARLCWDIKNKQRVEEDLIPMSRHSDLISDQALTDAAQRLTAMDTPPLRLRRYQRRPHPYYPSNNFHPHRPHQPHALQSLTSAVQTPPLWQCDLPVPSKLTTKIPLQYRQQEKPLPKGWAYVEGDEGVKTEDLEDPLTYSLA